MQKINIANSFGVNILGVHIPKNAIYGHWITRSGHKLTYYISDLEDFEKSCPNITAHVCYEKSTFRLSSISKTSRFGKFLCNYALNNIPYGTRVEYPLYAKRIAPKPKLPQTSFLLKISNQEQIDGRSYADKLAKHKNSNQEWDGTFDKIPFYDNSAYNGWADYR